MESKELSLKWSWFIVVIVGILFFSIFNIPTQHSYAQLVSPIAPSSVGLPIRVKIPKINIDTVIEQVSITAEGAMDVPKNPDNVGWFDLGPRPGEIGSAVIDGHSGFKDNQPVVFDNLYKLAKGDKIYVEDANGITTVFMVREFRNYNPEADATDIFTSHDGLIHLNLITCAGDWNPITKTHSDRLVVFTDKEI